MEKLKLTGQNLGRAFNSRMGRACMPRVFCLTAKRPILELKIYSKQLFGSRLLHPIALVLNLSMQGQMF